MHTRLLEKHRSIGNVNKKVGYCCPILIRIRVYTNFGTIPIQILTEILLMESRVSMRPDGGGGRHYKEPIVGFRNCVTKNYFINQL